MKKLFHPLSVFAFAAAPFVSYSIWRTGYGVTQLFEVRLFCTHYAWEVALLTSVVVACCFCYRKREKKIFSVVSAAAIGAFLALQSAEDYPTDYKLWIYIVAPIFVWSLALSSGFLLAIRKNERA